MSNALPTTPVTERRTQPRNTGRRTGDAHLREIERRVRKFLDDWRGHRLHLAAPATRSFIEDAGRLIAQLDADRDQAK